MAGHNDNSKARAAANVEIVMPLVINGYSASEIHKITMQQNGWQLSIHTIRSYIAKCKKIIEKQQIDTARYYYNLVFVRLEQIYAMALRQKDVKAALAIIHELVELTNIKRFMQDENTEMSDKLNEILGKIDEAMK